MCTYNYVVRENMFSRDAKRLRISSYFLYEIHFFFFEEKRIFLDIVVLKRVNRIISRIRKICNFRLNIYPGNGGG